MVADIAGADLVGLAANGHAHAAAHHVDRLLFRMLMRARAVAGAPVHLHDLDRLAAHHRPARVGMFRGDQMILVAVERYARHTNLLLFKLAITTITAIVRFARRRSV